MVEQQNTLNETEQSSEFTLQQAYLSSLIDRISHFAATKYWDYSVGVGEANAPSFVMAEQDRLRILDNLEAIRGEISAAFASDTIDGVRSKRSILFSALDRIQYLVAQISALRSAFHRFSPAMNRSAISQRSLFQSVPYRVDSVFRGSVDQKRSSLDELAEKPGKILGIGAVYGRFTMEDDFPDVYHGVRKLFSINHETEFSLVSSGMTAEVVSNLLLQKYLGDGEALICETAGRYIEHSWAKRRGADGVFSLNTRANTKFEFGDALTLWPKILRALSFGKKVVLQADLIQNSQQFHQTDLLSLDMLRKYYSLSADQRAKLIFHFDTSLLSVFDLTTLQELLPPECSIITVGSMNKFHQSGYDIGGVGLITDRTPNKWDKPLLNDLVSFGGLLPSPETLCTLDLLFSPELVEKRMVIIAANTRTMLEEFKVFGIDVQSIEPIEYFSERRLIGGLISLPKVGQKRVELLIAKLAANGIQIDYRTSFGHNITAIEDVHGQDWSRISVGIEDETTVRTIARTIAEMLLLDDAALEGYKIVV